MDRKHHYELTSVYLHYKTLGEKFCHKAGKLLYLKSNLKITVLLWTCESSIF